MRLIPTLLLLLPLTGRAGILNAPDDAWQVRHDNDWYPDGQHELIYEPQVGQCSMELVDTFSLQSTTLVAGLRETVKARRGGSVLRTDSFNALGARPAAVIHSVRLRNSGLYQMTWVAVPLGDGRAALLVLREQGSGASAGAQQAFRDIARSASLPGILQDLPMEELEALFGEGQGELGVALYGLRYDGATLQGELRNTASRTLTQVETRVRFRDGTGALLLEQTFTVVPGGDGQSLAPGMSKHFQYDAQVGGWPADGQVEGVVLTLQWQDLAD